MGKGEGVVGFEDEVFAGGDGESVVGIVAEGLVGAAFDAVVAEEAAPEVDDGFMFG